MSFLLGAGASFEAGLPLATTLTDKLIATIEQEERPFLEIVRRTMQARLAERANLEPNKKFSLDVDSETLYNTVDDLVHREQLEIAPFVTGWHPGLAAPAEPGVSQSTLQESLKQALHLAQGRDPSRLNPAISRLARLLLTSPRDRSHSQILERMRRAVIQNLEVDADSPTNYLSPLARLAENFEEPLQIATLNYDLAVEAMLSREGLSYSHGVVDRPNRSLDFSGAEVRINKLHGSADWYRGSGIITNSPPVPGARNDNRVVLFGGRNKLTAEWPFFHLLIEWRRWLEATERLCVIGYSFRDEHVNAIVSQWLDEDVARRLLVVNPHLPVRWSGHYLRKYLEWDSNISRQHKRYDDSGDYTAVDGPPADPRVIMWGKRTGEALTDLARDGFPVF